MDCLWTAYGPVLGIIGWLWQDQHSILGLKRIHACANLTLHRTGPTFDNATVQVEIGVDSTELFNRTFPIDAIERQCVKIEKGLISLCADFDNVNITRDEFSACVSLEADAFGKKIIQVEVDCFHFHI